jgi:hypothetical protein
MNTIKNTLEDILATTLHRLRELIMPFFNKYAMYFKYIDYFIYATYAILLLGFYNTVPQYIPVLRNILLYSAVIILLIRFNNISWNNPKFEILGGSKFSEFDRRLIMYICFFILITHIVSETVITYTKTQFSEKIVKPVSSEVINPIHKFINVSNAGIVGGI